MSSQQHGSGAAGAREDIQGRLVPVVAEAVGRQAVADTVADLDPASLPERLRAYMWEPVYHPYKRVYLHAESVSDTPDFAI